MQSAGVGTLADIVEDQMARILKNLVYKMLSFSREIFRKKIRISAKTRFVLLNPF